MRPTKPLDESQSVKASYARLSKHQSPQCIQVLTMLDEEPRLSAERIELVKSLGFLMNRGKTLTAIQYLRLYTTLHTRNPCMMYTQPQLNNGLEDFHLLPKRALRIQELGLINSALMASTRASHCRSRSPTLGSKKHTVRAPLETRLKPGVSPGDTQR